MSSLIQFNGVYKSYPNESVGVKEALISIFKKKENICHKLHSTLENITFSVEKGQSFGLVGHNGAGKSTLLSLIFGALRPDQGGITVNGSILPLLSLGSGFHPELTGKENIFLFNSIQGVSISETKEKYDSICAFSELGTDAINKPIRTYSSGMVARLGFSTVTALQGDIILIDEILGVGDHNFQKKCRRFLEEFKQNNGTLVIASQDDNSIKDLCDQGLALKNGRVECAGNIIDVMKFYEGNR